MHTSAPLTGARAWIFSDGKAGHEGQSLGVAEALGVDAEIKRVSPGGIFKLAAPWGPVSPKDRFGLAGSALAPPWPAIAFAAGRTTIPYIRALKRKAGLATFTVILMDPRTGANAADLIWVPEHDKRKGPNVVRTFAAPHRFSPAKLAELRRNVPAPIAALPSPRVACLIGGPNGDFRYMRDDQEQLSGWLQQLAVSGFGLMVTTSRRTPQTLADRLRTVLQRPNVYLWSGDGENPYADFLANADMFLITADSVSMLSEAASTGRPIYVFRPSGGSSKFGRFHEGLFSHGAARVLPAVGATLETWRYEPVKSAEVIANEIRRRWTKRAGLLSGLVPGGAP